MAQDIKDYLHLYPKVPIAICEPNTEPVSHYLEGIDWYLDKVIAERVNYPFEWVKPILRPLSDMTESEKYKFNPVNEDGEIGQNFIGSESETSYAFVSFIDMATTINQLRALGFDCDGLIDAGLAIDKTTQP